jgi:hypothetical protein
MSHRCRMGHETFDASQRLRQREALQIADKLSDSVVAAFQLEAHDRSETTLLATSNVMTGMTGQARVIDLLDVGLLLQPLRQSHRVAPVMIEPRVQRSKSPQRQEAVEGRSGYAKTIGPPDQLLVKGLVARNNRAANNVAVTIQVLGRRMEHEISAQCQRLLPRWRQERVVNDRQRSSGSTERCKFFDIRDPQQRIAGGFNPQQVRRLRKRGPHGCFITEVDELDLSFSALPPRFE